MLHKRHLHSARRINNVLKYPIKFLLHSLKRTVGRQRPTINHHTREGRNESYKEYNTFQKRRLINFHTRIIYGRLKSLHGASIKRDKMFVSGTEGAQIQLIKFVLKVALYISGVVALTKASIAPSCS